MKKLYHFSALIGTPARILKTWWVFLSFLLIVSGFGHSVFAQETIVETFTSSGTWTVPAGVTEITVEAWGAGGGGGGSNSNNDGGSGGGGGGYSMKTFTVTQNQSISFTVGTGGSGGAANGKNGGNGGNTSILGVVANGGTGGGANKGTAGAGGSASGGDIIVNGANGGVGGNTGGNGGNGANGGDGGKGARNGAGQNGASPGGGGGGGERMDNGGNKNRAGGAGANGQVRISYVPAFRADFITMDTGNGIWEMGETRTVSVTITNTGRATWTNSSPDINIGVKWNAELDYMVRVDADGLASGQTRTYDFSVTAPMTIGSNNLTFDVVNELACWFGDNDGVCGPGNAVFQSSEIIIVPSINKFYSYKSGSWSDVTTWTHDPSGTTQVGNSLPEAYDEVYLLSGRHVNLVTDVDATNLKVAINSGAILDLANYEMTGTLSSLSGQGKLRIASAFFPASSDNAFVLAGGGTVEYYNGTDFVFPSSQATYNNLVLNTPGVKATQKSDLVLNGDLLIRAGTFRINDGTSARYSLAINGDVTVDNGAHITVGEGRTNQGGSLTGGTGPFIDYYESNSHSIVLKGDFINNGTVRFTNQNVPDFNSFPNNGFATVYFQGATDNLLYSNGPTDFYNIVIDKGLDQTYKLTVQSTAYENFRLFGRNNLGGDGGGNNPNLRKALWIRTGTLVLEGMTVIPSLTEGEDIGTPNGDYYIPANAALVLNGPEVILLSTADSNEEIEAAYNIDLDGNDIGVGRNKPTQSFSIYGKLVINDGYMSTRESGGIITWDEASGHLEINGGFLDVKQIRAAGDASGKFAYQQSGGTVALRGRFQRVPSSYNSVSDLRATNETTISTEISTTGLSDEHATFNINSEANVFIMSGGKVQVYDVSGGSNRAVGINAAANNINVTGGSFEIRPLTGNTTFNVNSSAPFGDFVVNRKDGTGAVRLDGRPLVVKNNLSITSGVINANNLDVTVGGNFTVANGGTYNSGTNTTLFNGSSNQLFSVSGTLNNDAAGIFKMAIGKSAGSLKLTGDATTIAVQSDFTLDKGVFDDGGKTLTIAGNVKNAGTHIGDGKVQMNGNGAQTILGGGVFQNLELNNNAAGAPISLGDHLTIEGQLTFSQDRRFNIAGHNLKMGPNASFVGANANRYVVTSGEAGAGGITKEYASAEEFVFPLGVDGYTPATLWFSSEPTTFGAITVVPVNFEHPATSVKGSSLSYFWRVKSDGFGGIDGKVRSRFSYRQGNVAGNEDGYVPAVFQYDQSDWQRGTTNDIDRVNNLINSWTSISSILDGDYTAGLSESFDKPTKFYSRGSGFWRDAANWSTAGHAGTQATRIPSSGDIVVIGNGHTIELEREDMPKTSGWNRNNENPNTDVQNSALLQIEEGAVLDVTFNPLSSFGMVVNHPNGNGTIRVSTNYLDGSTFQFPKGDFSEFNSNLGTTELYTSNPNAGTTYWLPNDIDNYGNLILSPLGGSNIIFGNTDLLIYGDLTAKGTDSRSWYCPTWNSNYPNSPTGRRAKKIIIKGDFDLQGGALIYYGNNNLAQDFVIQGDFIIGENSGVKVYSNANNQSIEIGGSLINNAANPSGNDANKYRGADFTNIPLTFFGNTNAKITNSSGTPYTKLDKVTINKGASPATKLTIDIAGALNTPADNWLTFENGTLEYKRTNPNTDFAITTSTPLTIPASAGLWVESSATSNVLIANANSNNNDLFLNGKLTVVSGNVYVGATGSPNYNNDIEYAGGGASAIDIRGGQLVVNGQIRRNPSSASGILKYTQSGGELIINGRNANTTNAKLEVLNSGSVFNMSGGTLKLVRGGGGNAFGDLYLRPQSSSVTGGDIVFEHNLGGAQQYLLDATVPLNNLRIVGNSAFSANATVKLLISPLTLKGNLELSNANSVFDANEEYNIGLTLKGNLINNGVFEHRAASTTFNGGVQRVEGTSTTGFYDLKINPVTSVTMTKDVSVGHNLELASGQLMLGETSMTVQGNLTNNATYRNAAALGGIVLSGGDAEHQISGTGTFGRLELNNANGARLLNDVTLQNDFVLTAGVLNINQHLLTLGENALIVGSGFGSGKMISSDGVYSNVGVRKFFSAVSSTQEFTFPMGLGKKYTPAVLTIQQNNRVGSVRVNTINQKHPSVKEPYRVLNYYWEVESSAIEGFNGELNLFYADDDVMQDAGDEANYVAARLLAPGTSWTKAASGSDNVLEDENRIHFTFSGVDNIGGEYTAGRDEDIPDNVPVYESIANGEWSDISIWQPVGDSPPCPVGGPNGSVVHINHEVTVALDYRFAYRTNINGKLKILNTTFGHNLGAVEGSGTLYLESALMPAGRFNDFFSCSNDATLELGGNNDYYIVADLFSSIPNLKLSGSGSRYWPNKVLTICKSLLVDGAILDNTINNQSMVVEGVFELVNGGQFRAGAGNTATVQFAGSSEQFIGGSSAAFVGANAFNNLEVANQAGLTLNGDVEVKGSLLLTQGVIRTTDAELLKLTSSLRNVIAPNGGHAGSFVDGPLSKRIVQGDSFSFPVGKDGVFGNGFTLSAAQSGTIDWTVEYFMPNSDYMNYGTPLSYVNSKEYWTVKAAPGSAARMGASWTSSSDVTPIITQGGLSDLRISSFDSGANEWKEVASSASGNNSNGVVTSSNRIALTTGELRITTATVNTVKPKAKFTPAAEICGTEQGIPVTFTSSAPIALPYVLTYSIDGVEQASVTVSSLPFVLETPVVGAYQLLGFRYNNGLNEGVVDGDVVSIFATPTAANAGADIASCGATSALLAGNEPTIGVGLWTIVSGTGGTVLNPTEHNSVFEGTNGTAYTLRWTISNGSCESADEVEVVFPLLAEQPAAFNNYEAEVCQGATVIYSVPLDPTVSYNWSYSGSDVSISGSGHQVSVAFGPNATSGTLSVVAENDCNVSVPRTMEVLVNPLAPVSLSSSVGAEILCVYNSVLFTANSTGTGLEYSFYVNDVLQQSGSSNEFLANDMVDGDRVYVETPSAEGCVAISNEFIAAVSGTAGLWTGIADSDWNNPMNWCDGQVPVSNSNLVISSKMVHEPVVEDDITFDNLTIETEASMVLEGGARVDMTGLFRNDGELVLNNGYHLNGLVSLIQNGSTEGIGQTRIRLKLPVNEWYYVSHPVKHAKSGVYDVFMPGEDLTNNDFRDYSHVAFHRNNKWYRVTGANVALWNLEGMSVKYTPSVGDEHTLNYTGELNDEPISRSYDKGGFYLFGNPYSSYIDWQTTEGWERPELSGTIWYRTRVREEMGFVTYNRDAPVYEARVAVYPDGVEVGNEEEIALIPPYQSVWVRVWQPTTLSVSPVVRRHGLENSFLKSGRIDEPQVDVIRVISENSRSYDATVLYFYEHSTEEEDLGDSEKRFNETDQIPEVYTKVGSKAMAINGLPSLSSPTYSIPLGVKNQVAGSVSLRVELKHFDAAYSVYLEDKETGAFLRVNGEADYVYSSRAQGLVDDRFVLHLLKVTTSTGEQEWQAGDEQGISIKSVGGKALVTIADELLSYENAKVEVYTIEGRKVSETIVKNSRTLVVLPNMGGSFLIRASAGPVIRTGIALGSNR